jgi:adenosylcobinamide kinase/adenosylcobinamide-phosphate guanylyltransferase
MKKLTFITGGARSGKSSLALDLAEKQGLRRAFVATMAPLDEELRRRVEVHRAQRGDGWETFEEPLDIVSLLGRIDGQGFDAIVLDCLTLWLSNAVHDGADVASACDSLAASLSKMKTPVFVVSNELGMGVVPDNAMAREFRDHMGRLNQLVARAAEEVYLTIAGIPARIKP